jgi:hypothetical protein
MKAKYWLLAGAGCMATSIVLGIAMGLYWMGQVESFGERADRHHEQRFDDHFRDANTAGESDLFHKFRLVMLGSGLAGLLLFGGKVVLIVGFIKLAKEPSGDPPALER